MARKRIYKPARNEEERQRRNEYQRQYRAAHRDVVRGWREAYILRKAAKLLAQQGDQGVTV